MARLEFIALLAGSLLLAGAAVAQTAAPTQPRSTRLDDDRTVQATAKVTFGYVLSGDAAADEVSRRPDRPQHLPGRENHRAAG